MSLLKKFNIIIPSFNDNELVELFLNQVKKDKFFKDKKIVFYVIDDGSIKKFPKKFLKKKYIKLIINKHNIGTHLSILQTIKKFKLSPCIFYWADQELPVKDLKKIIILYQKIRSPIIVKRKLSQSLLGFNVSSIIWKVYSIINNVRFENISTMVVNNIFLKKLMSKNFKINRRSNFFDLFVLSYKNHTYYEFEFIPKYKKNRISRWTFKKNLDLLTTLIFLNQNVKKIYLILFLLFILINFFLF
tara:strand:- start:3651 stop:4385 length:735 start_codon:yes stop_codon:yes gene_type:complete